MNQDEIVIPIKVRKAGAARSRAPLTNQVFEDDPEIQIGQVNCSPAVKKPKKQRTSIAAGLGTAPATFTPEDIARLLDPYFIEGGKLKKWEKDKDGKTVRVIGSRVEILAVIIDEDTGEVYLELSYDYKGRTRTRRIPRALLARNKIVELLAYGVDIPDNKVGDVVAFLIKQEQLAPEVMAHSSLGVGEIDGKLVLKLARGIGFDSTYAGDLNLGPSGSYESWRQLMEDEVIGHPPLELALVFGLSSLVVSLLREVTGLDTLLVHLYGDSTQGKTTAAMLSVASFGEPHTTGGGLLLTWNATDNAVLGALRNNFGVPVAIDEASIQNSKDFTSVIYALSMGKDKARAKVDGSLQKSAQWSLTVISTAEHSLSSHANRNTGLQMRMLEFGNETWTKSADNSNSLKEGLRQNYGHAGEVFAEHLLSLGRDQVETIWREWRSRVIEELPEEDRFKARIADKLALVLATAEMAAEALSLDLDIDGIKRILLRADQLNAADRDLADKAYDFLIEHFTANKASFSSSPSGKWERPLCLGRYAAAEGQISEVYFLPDHLRRALKDAGFPDDRIVLRALRDRGWLDVEDNKLTRKKKVLGKMVNVYALKLREELPEDGPER